jgi:hypothetical protein
VYIPFLITKIKCLLNDRQSQDRECTYKVTLRHVRVTSVAVEEEKSVTYYECVFVALVTYQGNASAVLYGLLWTILLYHIIPHYLITLRFSEKVTEKSVLFSKLFHSQRFQRQRTRNIHNLHVKYLLLIIIV